ncbi:hypothetical protein GIB67_024525 [Kingdonia uniflora]|uniref:beta-galactosidase n=1 Tax=Kingdonia uniflora TaxID=39325 RepID=A0A7J7LP24_9MAGN|nr:hypothetical protein GIB67_024525 [Kingdonia uniflora]
MEPANIEDEIDEHINAPKWIDFSTLEDLVDKNDETLFFCIPVSDDSVLWHCGDDIGGDVLGMWRQGDGTIDCFNRKAGIIASLNTRTSVLACANPSGSRFDLIYLLLDKADEVQDRRHAKHIVALHFENPKMAMQGFTQKIVQLMKSEKLFESQGGPIILSQIENEYGPSSKALGAPGYLYMTWASKMAVELGTGVPWLTCKEDDAPDPITLQATIWIEAWSGQFTEFEGTIKQRSVQDLAYAVARFIQKGGSFVNYYMAHVFSSKEGGCAAFLANHNPESAAKVVYNNKHYNLSPWSISTLPDCEKVYKLI